MSQEVMLDSTLMSAYSYLPRGNYIFPRISFASCKGEISQVVFYAELADDFLDTSGLEELNVSVWRPAGTEYTKISEYTIQLPPYQSANGRAQSEVYVRISVNISVSMPVQRGDVLGLSLPLSESEETPKSVLAKYNDTNYIGLAEEAGSCWTIDEGDVPDCYVQALAAHPVIAVYLRNFENGKKSTSALRTVDNLLSYSYSYTSRNEMYMHSITHQRVMYVHPMCDLRICTCTHILLCTYVVIFMYIDGSFRHCSAACTS